MCEFSTQRPLSAELLTTNVRHSLEIFPGPRAIRLAGSTDPPEPSPRQNELNIGEATRCAGQGRIGSEELNPASACQRHIEGVGRGETVGKPVHLG